MVTAATKRMLVDREQAKAAVARVPPGEPCPSLLAMIDKAAPFMDEGADPRKWRPSEKLRVAYYAMLSGEVGPKRAGEWALGMLERARDLFRAGMHPDPWKEERDE